MITQKKPRILSLILALVFINLTFIPVAFAQSNESPSKEVIVDVYINAFDEEYIKNIAFDDGTIVGDYDYIINYFPMPRYTNLGDYFNYAGWITRDGIVSLSLDPVSAVRTDATMRDTAWNALSHDYYGFGAHPNWRNGQVMEWQYHCHYWFANDKERWNLEPHRTAGGYLEVVAARCNPGG